MLVGCKAGVRVQLRDRRLTTPIHIARCAMMRDDSPVGRRCYSLSARTRHPAMTKNQRHDNAAFQAVVYASSYAFQAEAHASSYAFQAVAHASRYAFKAEAHASS